MNTPTNSGTRTHSHTHVDILILASNLHSRSWVVTPTGTELFWQVPPTPQRMPQDKPGIAP